MENLKASFWIDKDRNALIIGNRESGLIIGQDGVSFLDHGKEYTLDELLNESKHEKQIHTERKSRMTNEEAIRRIRDHIVHHGIGQYPHIHIAEALQMAIAALRKEDDNWIPVTERLPDGECLAISMLPGQPSYKEKLLGYISKKGGWQTGYICESEREILPNVTHWMQPGLPKEKYNG